MPKPKFGHFLKSGAGNEARTRDLNLGKVALYQLSYSRAFDLCQIKQEKDYKLGFLFLQIVFAALRHVVG